MRKRSALVFLAIFLTCSMLPTTVLAEWKSYCQKSISLPQNNIYRLLVELGAGVRIEISIQMSLAIDVYLTDEPNMNKFWTFQSFTALVTHEGAAGITFEFVIPVVPCYLCIDNTNVFGVPSTGGSSGTIRIEYYDKTMDDLGYMLITLFLVIACIVVAIIAIYAFWWRSKQEKIE